MKPVEIDLYTSYATPLTAGDISGDPPEPAPDPGAEPLAGPRGPFQGPPPPPPIRAPAHVAAWLVERPAGLPAALMWPPRELLEVLSEVSGGPHGETIRQAGEGKKPTQAAWDEAIREYESAAAPWLGQAAARATRAGEFAQKLTPPADPAKLGFALFGTAPIGKPDIVEDPRERRKMTQEQRLAEDEAMAAWRRDSKLREALAKLTPTAIETRDGATVRSAPGGALACAAITPDAARLMVREAIERGWTQITVRGGPGFEAAIRSAAQEIPGAPPIVVASTPGVWARAAAAGLDVLGAARGMAPPAPPEALKRLEPVDAPAEFSPDPEPEPADEPAPAVQDPVESDLAGEVEDGAEQRREDAPQLPGI